MSRFFKGIANQKPSKAFTWDTNIVLEFLTNWYPNENLTLEKLTKKLSTLLALITAQRVQTLSKIKLSNIFETENSIKIKISDRLKTSKRLKEQPVLDIPFFPQKESIFPAKTLLTYRTMTEKLRPEGEDNLFITFKKPYHAATSRSISRWIKETLNQSGINTEVFTAHSTRHASTSAAARNGANIETIGQAAGWSKNSSVFARFYNRPLNNTESFAPFIISS